MTRWIKQAGVWAVLCSLFVFVPLTLARNNDERDQTIAQVMELSGLNHQLEQWPQVLQMQMAQQHPPIASDEYDAFNQIVLQAFEPTKVRQQFRDYLAEHYHAKRFKNLIKLLQTPLAKKMTAMENAANTPQTQQQMMQQANVFMAHVPPQRVAILREIDKEIMGSESIVAMQVKTFQTMTKAINPLLPAGQQMPVEQFEAISREIRQQSLYPAQQQMVLQMAWAYQAATDQELKKYLKMYRSDIGKWSTELMLDAMMAVFDHAAVQIVQQVKQKILGKRSA